MKTFHSAIALALAMNATASLHAADTGQRVEVSYRHALDVCAGLCLDEILIVSEDGNVFQQLKASGSQWAPDRHAKVAPEAAAAFMREMDILRLGHDLADPRECDRANHLSGVWDWDIRWIGPGGEVQLLTCEAQRTSDAWRAARKAIGMKHTILYGLDPSTRGV